MSLAAYPGVAYPGETYPGVQFATDLVTAPAGWVIRVLNGGQWYELPDYQKVSIGFDFSETGIVTIEYVKGGINYDKLIDESIVLVQWSGNEPYNGRFIVNSGDGSDDLDDLTEKFIGPSLLDIYRTVIVEENAAAPGLPIVFTAATAGGILINLLEAAQARGAATGITWNFTATHDSAGNPWAKVINIEYKLGLKYKDLINNLVDQGMAEVRFSGFEFQAFNNDGMGADHSENPGLIELKHGVDYQELPRKWSSAERAKYSMIVGDENTIVRRQDNTIPDGPFGRKEMALSQGGTRDVGTLTFINDAALSRVALTREQLTRRIELLPGRPIPGVNYQVSDYIRERITKVGTTKTTTSEKYRIRSLVIEIGEEGRVTTAAITLNDKFLENEIRLARRVAGIIGGATADGGGNGTPSDTTEDTTTPNPPTSVLLNSEAYMDSTGRTRSILAGSWVAPTLNVGGSSLTDLSGYEVNYRYQGTVNWLVTTTSEPNFAVSNLDPNKTVEVRVRAFDNANPPHRSTWTATTTTVLAADAIAPPQPSVPIATVRLGVVKILWDGLNNIGGGMPLDFSHIVVHRSATSGFTPVSTTAIGHIFASNGFLSIPDQAYNSTWYYRLVAVDLNGNASTPSDQVSAVTTPLVNADIIGKVLDGAKLIDQSVDGDTALKVGSVTTSRLDVGVLQGNLQINPLFQEESLGLPGRPDEWVGSWWDGAGISSYGFETVAPIQGERSFKISYTADTDRQAVVVLRAKFPCEPGDKFLLKAKFRTSRAVVGKKVMIQASSAADSANIFSLGFFSGPVAQADFTTVDTQLQGVFTIPAGHKWVALYLNHEAPADGGGAYHVIWDEVSIQKQVVSAVIADGSITTPLLAALAVKTPNLAANAVTADKVDVGAIEAENIKLGVFASNNVPDPSFEEDYVFGNWDIFGTSGVGNIRQWRISGDPEDRSVGATVTRITSHVRSGQKALKLYTPGGWIPVISGSIPLETGQRYKMVMHVASDDAYANMATFACTLHGGSTPTAPWFFNDILKESDNAAFTAIPFFSTDGWTTLSWEFVPTDPSHLWMIIEIINAMGAATESALLVDDVSIIPMGIGGTEITAAGIRVFGTDGFETSALVSNRPNLFSISKDGDTVASINQEGLASFHAVTVQGIDADADGVIETGLEIYGTEFTEWLNPLPKGLVAFGSRTVASGYSAVIAPFQQLDAVLLPGRAYKLKSRGYFGTDTNASRVVASLRYTTDGTAAGTTSGQACSLRSPNNYAANGLMYYELEKMFYVGGSVPVEYSFVICHQPDAGVGKSRMYGAGSDAAEMWVEDVGLSTPDTGIDRTAPTPPVTKKTYTTTWSNTSSGTYKDTGTKRTNTTDVVQGYTGVDTNGNNRGLFIFPSMTSTLSGSTVNKIEVYCYFNHWYYNGGGTARINVHGYSSAPASSPSLTYATQSTGWPKPGGRWVTLPSSFHAGFISGAYRGFGLGPGASNSQTYYGRANGTAGAAKIRITYTK